MIIANMASPILCLLSLTKWYSNRTKWLWEALVVTTSYLSRVQTGKLWWSRPQPSEDRTKICRGPKRTICIPMSARSQVRKTTDCSRCSHRVIWTTLQHSMHTVAFNKSHRQSPKKTLIIEWKTLNRWIKVQSRAKITCWTTLHKDHC